MTLVLPPELEQFVQDQISSGAYGSTTEVIHESLRLLQRHEQIEEMRRADLRERIAVAQRQFDRGETHDGEEVFAELRRMSEERRKAEAS